MRWFLKLLWDDFVTAPITYTSATALIIISLIQPDTHRADHAVIIAFILLLGVQVSKLKERKP